MIAFRGRVIFSRSGLPVKVPWVGAMLGKEKNNPSTSPHREPTATQKDRCALRFYTRKNAFARVILLPGRRLYRCDLHASGRVENVVHQAAPKKKTALLKPD